MSDEEEIIEIPDGLPQRHETAVTNVIRMVVEHAKDSEWLASQTPGGLIAGGILFAYLDHLHRGGAMPKATLEILRRHLVQIIDCAEPHEKQLYSAIENANELMRKFH